MIISVFNTAKGLNLGRIIFSVNKKKKGLVMVLNFIPCSENYFTRASKYQQKMSMSLVPVISNT